MTASTSPSTVAPQPTPVAASGPTLATIAEALDPRRMGPRLDALVGGGPRNCHVLDAKFEPGVRASVLYAQGDQLLRGDVLPPDESSGPDGPEPVVVPPGVQISVFPQDPELPALPDVMDPAWLGPVLAEHVDGLRDDARPELTSRCRLQLLRYRPGKRATLRVDPRPGRAPLVVKAYHNLDKASAVSHEAAGLHAAGPGRTGLRFAPPVGHVPAIGVVVQRLVPGVPLDALLSDRRGRDSRAAEAVRRAGLALADLHALPVVSERHRSVEEEVRRFGLRAARVGTVDRRLGDVLGSLAARLMAVYSRLPCVPLGLVHGDCKPSQFLLTSEDVYVLDLDHCGVSDPASDVGTFLASLRQLATRRLLAGGSQASARELTDLGSLFLRAYHGRRDDPGMGTRVQWHEAVALERKALRAFARSPFSPLAGSLAEEANRCLDRLTVSA